MSEGLVAALAAAQAEFAPIAKSNEAEVETKAGRKYKYQYADLADVLASVRPVLAKHGIALVQTTETTEHGAELVTALLKDGDRIESRFVLPVERADAQGVGSLLSYHRRYQACAICGVQPEREDDDGAAAKGIKHERAPRNVDRDTGEVRRNLESAPPNPSARVKAALHGLGYNPTQRKQFVTAVIGHHAENVNDLTADELGLVLDAVARVEAGEAPSFSPAGCVLSWQAGEEPFEVNAS